MVTELDEDDAFLEFLFSVMEFEKFDSIDGVVENEGLSWL